MNSLGPLAARVGSAGRSLAPGRLEREHRPADPYVMSLAGAGMYGAGGVLVLLSVAVSPPPGPGRWGVLAVATIASAVAIGLLLGRRVVPGWIFPYLTATGSILITLLLLFDGSSASAYSLLYVWAALYAFYFYSPPGALLQVLVIAVASGLELHFSDHGNMPITRWFMIVGTSLVAGVVIQQLVQNVRQMADRDGLTGIANRRRLEAELSREIGRAGRERAPLSVLMLDLDNFKKFNDEMGHVQGDTHLRRAAALWSAELRPSDVLARFGGEEFAVILPGAAAGAARAVADRVRGATPHGQTASAGVATWDGSEDGATLIGRADAALYEAKVAGRDRTIVAAVRHDDGAITVPQAWAQLVPEVLAGRAVRIAHQPVVDLLTREIVAYEGLARPGNEGSDVSVEGFFAAAQRLGHGRDLDWMCRRATLEQSRPLIREQLLFINIGVPALLSPLHPVDQMAMLLESTGWQAKDIVLEITERDMVSDLARLEDVLAEYRGMGFRFAVDDVGDGHSTLEVLAAACPEYIKIARRLTAEVERPGPRAAVRGIIAFAESLGSQTVAEGIETESQAEQMLLLGCALGQGYHLGRPEFLRPVRPQVVPDAVVTVAARRAGAAGVA